MNYYVRTQQVLSAHAVQSSARMAYMHGLRGMGQSVGLPAGSRLTYSATFLVHYSTLTGTRDSLATVVQQLTSALGSYGILVTGQTLGPESVFTDQRQIALTLTTQSDRNSQNDVKSVLDGLLANMGNSNVNSTIGVISVASASPDSAPAPPPSQDFGQWFSDNWGWVVLAGVGVLVVSEVL